MLLGHRIPLSQQLHVRFVKSEELHASLEILGKEYSVLPLGEQRDLMFHRGSIETELGVNALLVCRNARTTGSSLFRWQPSPVPKCPSGRILARPERAWMRLPSPKGGPVQLEECQKRPGMRTHDVAYPFPQSAGQDRAPAAHSPSGRFSLQHLTRSFPVQSVTAYACKPWSRICW